MVLIKWGFQILAIPDYMVEGRVAVLMLNVCVAALRVMFV